MRLKPYTQGRQCKIFGPHRSCLNKLPNCDCLLISTHNVHWLGYVVSIDDTSFNKLHCLLMLMFIKLFTITFDINPKFVRATKILTMSVIFIALKSMSGICDSFRNNVGRFCRIYKQCRSFLSHSGTFCRPFRRICENVVHSHIYLCQRLRSATRHQFIVPWHRRRPTKIGRRAFSVAGPTAWNSLPDCLRDMSLSEDTFRRSLKTCFFALY